MNFILQHFTQILDWMVQESLRSKCEIIYKRIGDVQNVKSKFFYDRLCKNNTSHTRYTSKSSEWF